MVVGEEVFLAKAQEKKNTTFANLEIDYEYFSTNIKITFHLRVVFPLLRLYELHI